jgi:hypothetical protein
MTQVFVVTVEAGDPGQAHNAPVAVFSAQDSADAYIAEQQTAHSGATYFWRATGYDLDALAPVKHAESKEKEHESSKSAKAHEHEPAPPPKGNKR